MKIYIGLTGVDYEFENIDCVELDRKNVINKLKNPDWNGYDFRIIETWEDGNRLEQKFFKNDEELK